MSLENFNPYNDLLGLMRDEGKYYNSLTPIVGKITKVNDSLTDIEIIANSMPLDKDDLLIDTWILDRHTKQFTSQPEGLYIHEIKEPLVDKLKIGDLVLLVPYGEKFIISSKVVSI